MRRSPRALIAGLALVTLLSAWGCSSAGTPTGSTQPKTTSPGSSGQASAPQAVAARTIAQENALQGTDEWRIRSGGDDRDRAVEGWASVTSATRGEKVDLYVTSRDATWTATAYRMGWYKGLGGREVWRSDDQPGVVQPACTIAATTRMVDCSNWKRSLTVTIGDDWTPGEYLFKLEGVQGHSAYVPFVVRDDTSRADVLVINSVTTWQAYNTWGGHSLYQGLADGSAGRSYVVSFDRPYDLGWGGSGHFFGGTLELVQQLEAAGTDVTYATNIDQHLRPELLRNHKLVISLAHDEYYSPEMRTGTEAARDAGVNLMFLGANAVFRRIRLEPSAIGQARHEVNYRVASLDPLMGKDPTHVTSEWRDAPDPKPESSLIGNYYECNPVKADMVIVDADAWMFQGTGITNGTRFKDLVQNEYDRVTPEAPTPDNIQVLAHSPLTCRGRPSFADMTYYTAPSGAGVFATGTLWWVRQLGPECAPSDVNASRPECQLRKITANLVDAMSKGPVGAKHPSQSNLAEFGIAPGYVHGGEGTGDESEDGCEGQPD